MIGRLRGIHSGIWISLDRPTLFPPSSLRSTVRIIRFLTRREYAALDDPDLARLAEHARILLTCTYVAYFVGAVLFLVAELGIRF